jgi:dTDP-4-amino-4,6-dideoxygalactose transaminase
LMNDFHAEPEELLQKELVAVERVLRSGWYVLGNEVKAFEKQWSERCGTREAIGVANGMDAIEIGLRALGIGLGDEVITTSMTAFATVLAILRAGAVPVLADIDTNTALLSIESVTRCISPRTKAVLLVHLYGQIKNMGQWEDLCKENNLLLLEDCAQSHMAEWEGRIAGNFGRFGAYSFYPTKNLGAVGDAGALVTSDIELAEQARQMRNYGQSERYHHPVLGLNSRLDELHAAILTERLAWLDRFTEKRRTIAQAYYREMLNPRIRLLSKPESEGAHVYHLFVVLCAERDKLSNHLTKAGIANLSHYPVPIHKQPPCQSLSTDPSGLPNAEQHASDCLSIPCHPQMTDNQVDLIIETINAFQ